MENKIDLQGKVAIVTGASKGIGESIALALGKAGAKVVVSSRKQSAVNEVAAQMVGMGIDAVGIACNTGETVQIEKLVEETHAQFGGVDILVNNAATNPIFGPVVQADLNAFDKIMDVNVKGPFYLAKLCYPFMKQRGGGSVINISSVEGLSPGFGLGLYSVSKSALIMLTKVMAKEWGPDRIRVNTICPGLIKTKFSEALWSNEMIMKQVMQQQPIKEIGMPDDVAGLALLLASDWGNYCTGATFTVDGGLTI
jgi:NAD(P)-dependent dehydrogenase (short-subunit alcohol dehydrogenase family)